MILLLVEFELTLKGNENWIQKLFLNYYIIVIYQKLCKEIATWHTYSIHLVIILTNMDIQMFIKQTLSKQSLHVN